MNAKFERIEHAIREVLSQEIPVSMPPPEIVYERPSADIERIVITFTSPHEATVATTYVAPLQTINVSITLGGDE